MQILPLRVRRVRCRPNSQLKDWLATILNLSEASDQKNLTVSSFLEQFEKAYLR